MKESLWISCPICKGKTRVKVFEDTVLLKFPLYCPWCKKNRYQCRKTENGHRQRARRMKAQSLLPSDVKDAGSVFISVW